MIMNILGYYHVEERQKILSKASFSSDMLCAFEKFAVENGLMEGVAIYLSRSTRSYPAAVPEPLIFLDEEFCLSQHFLFTCAAAVGGIDFSARELNKLECLGFLDLNRVISDYITFLFSAEYF